MEQVPLPQVAQVQDATSTANTLAAASATSTATSVTSSTGITNAELVGYAAAGLGALLFLTVGGIFYRKYRKRKLKAEETVSNSEIEERAEAEKNAQGLETSKSIGDIDSESEVETKTTNLAGRGIRRARPPSVRPNPAASRRKDRSSLTSSASSSEDDEAPRKPRSKPSTLGRAAKKPIKKPVSDLESEYSTDTSSASADSHGRSQRKV